VLGAKVIICKPADPEAKGIIERLDDYLARSFLPGRSFTSPLNFNTQLQVWLGIANRRRKRSLGLRPCGPDRRGSGGNAAKPGTGCCSPPPANGLIGSPTPTPPDGCKPNSSGSAATRCSWSIRSAYIPFEPEAANLFFQLVSSRYERASLIVTFNKPLGRWGEVFGDEVVATAMIDRPVYHAEVVSLRGDSYRLKD
jgi:hypothetical protein